MTTYTGTATLTAIGEAVVRERPSDAINVIPPKHVSTVDFFHGIRRVEGSDTTFTSSAPWHITFASTVVSSVVAGDRVYALGATGHLLFGDVTGVSGGTVTVAAWNQNETEPSVSSTAPVAGSRVVINVVPVQLSYTVGVDVHTPAGAWRYTVNDDITFNAYAALPRPRYPAHYRWDMGDGTILTGRTVTHRYTSPSAFRRVVVTITDDHAKEYVIGKQVYVLTVAPPPDYLNIAKYVNADTQDATPTSALVIDGTTHRFTLVPQVVGIVHNEYSYGFGFTDSASVGNVLVTQKYFTGANSDGTLASDSGTGGNQRFNGTIGLVGKVTPGNESTGIGLFGYWGLPQSRIGLLYYDYTGPGGWFDFNHNTSIGSTADAATITTGSSWPGGFHYRGTALVASTTYAVSTLDQSEVVLDEFTNPITPSINTIYWQRLRLQDNLIEFEIWDTDPALAGSYLLKMSVNLVSAGLISRYGTGSSGMVGPAGDWSPSPGSYIDSWSYVAI